MGDAFSVPGTSGVSFVGAAAGARGQASRSTGKSVQALSAVQMFKVIGVISGPLHRTTCWPLFTSTVVQAGVDDSALVLVVLPARDVILNVAVSGRINSACATPSIQN